ncbi:hypothetical protein EET67_05070 [Pseudaminobacter arsenicus]|uniref:Uncharacterized protein n=1 Tax=Borborobacter arsenicus TaxID=1851146 RepID=A0A432VA94_9HYPH|nr:hypothetical protein [Pseudaminobacter arsenicus]RUM99013.1 hypothetical protein EET67_05070 [Pseudaminobacter arsenicus]
MQYNIKAIPTTYAGVNFRSRLEARWAAFFDLCGWKWDYEPFDLEGWAPDFRLRTKVGPVLCEVKPADLSTFILRQLELEVLEPWPFHEYRKALPYRRSNLVCLLGDTPLTVSERFFPIGFIDGRMPIGCGITFEEYDEALSPSVDAALAWREAGNVVQWTPDNNNLCRRAA